MSFTESIRKSLQELESASLLRTEKVVRSKQQPQMILNGKNVLCFCSNNYLGLAADPKLCSILDSAVRDYGLGSGASRLISGTITLHREAELALAHFVNKPDAVLFSSGYAANVGTIQALVSREDAVFSDALNHASLIDGCRLSRAEVHIYAHRDMEHLEKLLLQHRPRARRRLS